MASVPLPWDKSRRINVQNKGKKEVNGTLAPDKHQSHKSPLFPPSAAGFFLECAKHNLLLVSFLPLPCEYRFFPRHPWCYHCSSHECKLKLAWGGLFPELCSLWDCCCNFLVAPVFMTLFLDLPLTLSCLVMSRLVETGELSSLKWNLVGYWTKLRLFTSAACHFQCSVSSIT